MLTKAGFKLRAVSISSSTQAFWQPEMALAQHLPHAAFVACCNTYHKIKFPFKQASNTLLFIGIMQGLLFHSFIENFAYAVLALLVALV